MLSVRCGRSVAAVQQPLMWMGRTGGKVVAAAGCAFLLQIQNGTTQLLLDVGGKTKTDTCVCVYAFINVMYVCTGVHDMNVQ